MGLATSCRATKGLRVKARSAQGASSDPFVSATGFVMCIDGLNGKGAYHDITPFADIKSKK
jgi:hypothetical protein